MLAMEHLLLLPIMDMQAFLDLRTSRAQYLFPLPAVVVSSSLKRLILQVDLYLIEDFSISEVDWSLLAALLPLKSIHLIKLSVSAEPCNENNPAAVLSILERNADLSEMVRREGRTDWAAYTI